MNNEIMSKLLELIPAGSGMELPPKVFDDMDGEFIEYIEGESLTARFPNKERYMNPFCCMQGGIIVAAIDNTVSPLSYLLAPPNVTKEISTNFKRPINETDRYIDVKATMVEQTSSHIVLNAEVRNEQGKLAAKAIVKCVIVKEL